MRRELVCTEAAMPPRLAVRSVELPHPGSGEVLVRVQATPVNPIDAKRAAGYGRRLLGLKGAARFDRLAWLGGAWASRRDWNQVRAIVASRAPKASYAWTLFKPDRDALEALAKGVRARRLALPIGIAVPLDNAIAAFDHVSAGLPGRAVLLP